MLSLSAGIASLGLSEDSAATIIGGLDWSYTEGKIIRLRQLLQACLVQESHG